MKKVIGSIIAIALCMSLVACSVDQVLDDINVAVQIAANIGTAVGSVSPADELAIQALANTATAGLNVVQSAYNAYAQSGATTDLQKVQAAVSAAKANLVAAMAAAHITDPASQQKVSNWFNLLAGSLTAILAALPALQVSQLQMASFKEVSARKAFTIPLSASGLKSRWDKEVCSGEAKCTALVKTPRHGVRRIVHFGKK